MLEFFARLREWIEDHVSWKVIGMALVIVAVVAFCGGNLYQEWRTEGEGLTLVQEDATAGETAADSAAPENASGEVVVHVAGAVSSPGVYTLPADSRVDDAVRAAGATADADLSQLNLAQKLADGQKITVPAAGETPAPADNADNIAPSDSSQSGALININTATLEELETLPSIGEVRAQAIIAYREEHGGFRTTDELMEVSGIGEKIFADIAPHITV